MDENSDKKKESIDDILADLNGLLNRMPSILDGIKLPPLKPVEFEKPVNDPKPEPLSSTPGSVEVPDASQEDTVRWEPPLVEDPPDEAPVVADTGVSVQMQPDPIEQGPEPRPREESSEGLALSASPSEENVFDESDFQTLVINPRQESVEPEKKNVGLPSPVPLDEPEQKAVKREGPGSVPMSAAPLFGSGPGGDEGNKSAVMPTPENAAVESPEPPSSGAGVGELSLEDGPVRAESGKNLPVIPPQEEPFSGAQPLKNGAEEGSGGNKPVSYESTVDFGIPDIDALFKISQGEVVAAEPALERSQSVPQEALPQAGAERGGAPLPGPADEVVPADAEVSGIVLSVDLPQEDTVQWTPPSAEQPETPAVNASSGGENLEQELEKLTISDEIPAVTEDGAAQERAGDAVFEDFARQKSPAAEGGAETAADTEVAPMALINENEPAGDKEEKQDLSGETFKSEPAATASGEGLVLEQPGAGFFTQNPPEGDKTMVAPPETAQQSPEAAAEPAPQPAEASPAGGVSLELSGAVFSEEEPSEGDKTLVIAPPASDEEHTVIYQADPDTASKRLKGAEDLVALSQKQPPEGVPEDRIRSLAFLYPEGEEWFCAEVLSELDAICLKSQSNPMFVRRAFVRVFELNTNPNFMFQAVADAKADGLILTGTLPQDKVYELESVFSSSGGLFRRLTEDTFNHSSALDLVSELILR